MNRSVCWLRKTLIALGALCASAAAAQDGDLARANALNQQVGQLISQGKYAEATPLATQALAIREKILGPQSPDVATSLNNLAQVYYNLGRYAEAEPLYKRSMSIVEKVVGHEHPIAAASLNNLATLYVKQGRYAEAEPLFKRALAIREKALGPEHLDVAQSSNNLATLYDAQGRYADAEPLFKRSLAVREKALGSEHPSVAVALNNLAALYVKQGHYADAEPLYKRSLAIFEKALGLEHPNVAMSLNNLATLYYKQGLYAEAGPLFKRSLAIWERALGPEHPDFAASLNNLARVYYNQGLYAEAEPLYKRALAMREKGLGSDHPYLAESLGNLAELYRKQDRLTEAVGASRRAVALLGKRFSDGAVDRTGGVGAEQRDKRAYFVQNVALVQALGEATAPAETFRVAQLASGSSAAQAVAGMAARFAAGSDSLAAAVRERQDLARQWQWLDGTIVQAASRPPAQRDAATEASLREQFVTAGTRLDALDVRIAREFPTYAELSRPQPLELAAAQALLAPDEALLVYLSGSDATWLWVLRRDRAAMHQIDIGAEALAGEVTALRSRLDPMWNPTLKPFEATRAYALHQKILAPATPLLDGARQVFIVPDGALEGLPMGVLVTKPPESEPEEPADHRAIAWFARDYAVTVLPSVGSLRALRQFASVARAGSPFVGIGNPTLEGQPGAARGVKLASLFRGALADVDKVRELPPLPETAVELRAVAKSLGAGEANLYLADRATEPIVRSIGLDRYRVIEFATHGLMSGDLKGLAEPALVLTPPIEATAENDGLLTASEIATLKLNADWVVLSACNTAAADGTPDAGGLSGLAKAFFYAGARSLLVSHWEVETHAAVKLITGAFEALKKDPSIGRAEALRRAEMAMMDPSNPPEFSHPLAWAPFVLAGEGGAGR